MINKLVHFSSETVEWETDREVFSYLNRRFGPFVLDVCATADNAKCPLYFTKEQDGLRQQWTGPVWMNPPYGRTIGEWMKRAHQEGERGNVVVCLVPARTDTNWWHNYAIRGRVFFVRGRLKFGGAKHGAPFPSAVVIFGPYADRGEE